MSPGCDHKGVRKDALMVHMRKAHGRQFDYGELQHLFKEQVDLREARSKANRAMLNSLNGYHKRTQDAYINLQWTKHVASICRNKCWPHLPPVDRRGKGKQPEAVMPSEEEMENHRLWFFKKKQERSFATERQAKEMYQNGVTYQPSECSHSRPDSDSDSGTGGGQEITDEGSQPSERETDAEETSLEVEDSSTPRGETPVSGDERSCELGDVSVPRMVSEEESATWDLLLFLVLILKKGLSTR
ncbi:hypothetical protein K3495_g10504 [Podosphaera aphanis]|nr:hypothetical protein K3495_g10504 [Podosphaera aphanis]